MLYDMVNEISSSVDNTRILYSYFTLNVQPDDGH